MTIIRGLVGRRALRFGIGVAMLLVAGASGAQEGARADVERVLGEILREVAAACPLATPGDQAAFERCRETLYRNSLLQRSLTPIVLWGRQRADDMRLKDTPLTQFAADIWSGLYAPLFMFTNSYDLEFDQSERLYRATVPALFRNALDYGQYPYPFWHEAAKWNTYQARRPTPSSSGSTPPVARSSPCSSPREIDPIRA